MNCSTVTPDWVKTLYKASTARVSDEQIIEMFDALENAIYTNVHALDLALAAIDVKQLAPEFVVGISRALFPLKDQLSNWHRFVLKAQTNLSRPGLNVHELLQGLLREK